MRNSRSDATKNLVIVLAMVAAGFFTAYRFVLPKLVQRASYTDGERRYEGSAGDGIRYAVWDEPLPLPGNVNSPEHESRPALSPDGRWLVFAVGREGLNSDLYVSEMIEGVPGEPRPIAIVNSVADEFAPAFGADGLYFASNRGGGSGGFDLYRAPFEAGSGVGTFGPARWIEAKGVNTPADETDPAPGPQGLFFCSRRGSSGFDIFVSRLALAHEGDRGATEVVAVEALNSRFDEREPGLTADGRTLFFASDCAGDVGEFSLYRSLEERGTWLPPSALTGLKVGHSQRGPQPTPDGFALYFESSPLADGPAEVAGDLYRARSLELFRLPAAPVGWLDVLLLVALLCLALLAWLAKRWETLDVLYRCLLLSILIHLLLLWWFRHLHPEAEVHELGPGPDATFQVRMLSDDSAGGGLRERAGALEVARAERTQAESLQRLEQALPERDDSGVGPTPAREVSLARAELGPAPEREVREVAPTTPADANAPAPALRDDEPGLERMAANAPALTIQARTAEVQRSPVEAAAAPTRAELDAPSRASLPAISAAGGKPRLERREQAEVSSGVEYAPLEQMPPSLSGPKSRGPEIAQPRESFVARSEGAAPEQPALPSPTVFAPGRQSRERSADAPVRAELDTNRSSLPAISVADETRPLERREPERTSSEGTYTPLEQPPRPTVAGSQKPRGPEIAQPRESFVARGESPAAEEPSMLSPTAFTPARQPRERRASESPAGPRRLTTAERAQPSEPEPEFRPLTARVDERPPAPLPEAPSRLQDTPYRSRFGSQKEVALETHGGSEETERAVAQGLAYLASIQTARGHWGSPADFDQKYHHVLVGKTGLALLAFLGAGHTPQSRTMHSENTQRAIDFLLGIQDEQTGHFGDSSSYSHGIATYALAECYAITGVERLRRPIERAIGRILGEQVRSGDERKVGGWSYYYLEGHHYDAWPRVSITSWQVMALESARLGGIEIPEPAVTAARDFLLGSWDRRLGAFRYSHDPVRLRSGYPTLPGSTPAALFALSLLGEDLRDSRYDAARRFIVERAPDGYRFTSSDDFVHSARGNLYFWYYGSLALLRSGGHQWNVWNAAMQEALLGAQQRDGSWVPIDVYAQYAGDDDGDRSYTTSLCVLTLEVYYRYFTPLLQVR